MPGKLLTAKELAAYLDVPVRTIYKWNSKGTGPRRIHYGVHVRYRLADVDTWLEAHAERRKVA